MPGRRTASRGKKWGVWSPGKQALSLRSPACAKAPCEEAEHGFPTCLSPQPCACSRNSTQAGLPLATRHDGNSLLITLRDR